MIRLKLKAYQALTSTFSNEDASAIIEYIESSNGIPENRKTADFPVKPYLSESCIESEISISNFCSEIKIEIEGLRTEMYKGFNNQLKWMVGVMIGTASLAIAIIKLL